MLSLFEGNESDFPKYVWWPLCAVAFIVIILDSHEPDEIIEIINVLSYDSLAFMLDSANYHPTKIKCYKLTIKHTLPLDHLISWAKSLIII